MARIADKALTLIEMIVSAALFSLLSVALYSLLRTGIVVRQRIAGEDPDFYQTFIATEHWRQDLRNIIRFKADDSDSSWLKGQGQLISFVCSFYDHRSQLQRLQRVSYEFHRGSLIKTISSPLALDQALEKEIISGIKDVRFSYYDKTDLETITRLGSWTKSDQLPLAVGLTIAWANKPKGEKTMHRYVVLAP